MPDANCPECDGTGWKIVEREEISGAVKCNCVDFTVNVISRANIPPLYANASFENFRIPDEVIERHELSQAFFAVRTFVREFPAAKKPGLLLMGGHGTGKTHLAVAALRAIVAKGHEGLFFDYQHLLDRIRSSYDSASQLLDKEAYRDAMESEVLLLDDLGSHRNVTDWVEDTVTSIVTARCNNRKPLIATTNLVDPAAGYSTSDLRTTLEQRLGPRARSRLFEMCRIVKLSGAVGDFRERKQGAS
ncbi:MAG TPA: ATP-binding protein [Bryobacteraceae bacterium]|nr:ATP-binding protein [Bryobacteraceae bacterium]